MANVRRDRDEGSIQMRNKEIRTQRGKLVGVFYPTTSILCIKDRKKETLIAVPLCGLILQFTPGDGIIEEIHIQPNSNKTLTT